MIFSLQGSMAVGKTSALAYLEQQMPEITCFREDTQKVVAEIKKRQLNKDCLEDYLEIQRLWIGQEIRRYQSAREQAPSLLDFGAEEIEFYTLCYPKSRGFDWEIEEKLQPELEELRRCLPDRILFLDASRETLFRRKEADQSRSRNFFSFYVDHLLPLKKEWFAQKSGVDYLTVDGLSREEVGQAVQEWCQEQLKKEATDRP